MLIAILCIFILGILLGIYLSWYVMQNKTTPKAVAFIHGPLGSIGIILLLIFTLLYAKEFALSLIIFIIAALIGFILIYRDITGKSLPKWLVMLHGLLAFLGLTLFIYTWLS